MPNVDVFHLAGTPIRLNFSCLNPKFQQVSRSYFQNNELEKNQERFDLVMLGFGAIAEANIEHIFYMQMENVEVPKMQKRLMIIRYFGLVGCWVYTGTYTQKSW